MTTQRKNERKRERERERERERARKKDRRTDISEEMKNKRRNERQKERHKEGHDKGITGGPRQLFLPGGSIHFVLSGPRISLGCAFMNFMKIEPNGAIIAPQNL